jgi:hypothetical protein
MNHQNKPDEMRQITRKVLIQYNYSFFTDQGYQMFADPLKCEQDGMLTTSFGQDGSVISTLMFEVYVDKMLYSHMLALRDGRATHCIIGDYNTRHVLIENQKSKSLIGIPHNNSSAKQEDYYWHLENETHFLAYQLTESVGFVNIIYDLLSGDQNIVACDLTLIVTELD